MLKMMLKSINLITNLGIENPILTTLDVEDKTEMSVFAFKEATTRSGLTYLLVCADKEVITAVTNYISKLLNKGAFNTLELKSPCVYSSLSSIVAYRNLSGKKIVWWT